MRKRSTMHLVWFIGLFVSPYFLGPYGPLMVVIVWLIDAQNTKNHNRKYDTWKQEKQLNDIVNAIREGKEEAPKYSNPKW